MDTGARTFVGRGNSPGPPRPTQYTACDGDNVGTLDIHRPELPTPTITWNGYRIGTSWDNPNVSNSRVEYYEWGIDEISPRVAVLGTSKGMARGATVPWKGPAIKNDTTVLLRARVRTCVSSPDLHDSNRPRWYHWTAWANIVKVARDSARWKLICARSNTCLVL